MNSDKLHTFQTGIVGSGMQTLALTDDLLDSSMAMQALNTTLKPAFFTNPNVAAEELRTFNNILSLYNQTLAGQASG